MPEDDPAPPVDGTARPLAQEVALKKLHDKIFALENPCAKLILWAMAGMDEKISSGVRKLFVAVSSLINWFGKHI
ncbi:hypothetical protein [Paremcibacter congregatus]|uniref:hypothetical protein n=1 Tax=Paremcibacter congregatus TaxID=2043170 RepID=UPI0010552DDE|nr:hypothetical protein [Paremcibacter congregatus]QDE28530.1 hypothetical protein FIV45_15260 [Paremcibacter congregatus]